MVTTMSARLPLLVHPSFNQATQWPSWNPRDRVGPADITSWSGGAPSLTPGDAFAQAATRACARSSMPSFPGAAPHFFETAGW